MKALLATAIAAILSLFGIHPAATNTAHISPRAQVASVAAATNDPFHPASNRAGTTTQQSSSPDSTTSSQAPIIKQYITQPVIERVIQSPPTTSGQVLGASTDDTAAKLSDLQDQINALSRLPTSVFVPTFSGPAASTPVSFATFAHGQRIDNLSGTSLSDITVNGISGLTDADIPDDLTASAYLPLTGGTLSGDFTITGSFTVSGAQTLSGAINIPYLTATSTATPSSFQQLLVNSSTTLQNFTATNGTTTNLYASNLSAGTLTGSLQDKGGQVFNVKSYGAVGDGTTNDSTAVNAALTAAYAAGGGTVYFPAGTFLITTRITIPNDGTSSPAPHQLNIRLMGAAGGKAWGDQGASILDLRYDGSGGKITSLGLGTLRIDGITFTDGGTSNSTPFIYDTNTVLTVRDNIFVGNSASQDAIVLGGTCSVWDGTVDSQFTGYGTEIVSNEFSNLNRGVYLRTYANAVIISNNAWYDSLGTRAIEADASMCSTGHITGLIISGNTMEMTDYTYGIVFNDVAKSTLSGNNFYDQGSNFVSNFYFINDSTDNIILGGLIGNNPVAGDATSTGATLILGNELGGINIAAGTSYQYNNLNVVTASTTLYNYFFGPAGNLSMTGNTNTAVGEGALSANATGTNNIAVGGYALHDNTTGSYNSAFGSNVLQLNTTGSNNSAFGMWGLYANTTGSYNTANGWQSLFNNTTGSYNTADGYLSLRLSRTGSNNVSIGATALYNNASATNTVAIGYQAARGNAVYNNQGGTYVGYNTGRSLATDSDYNTILGYQAGYSITTGSNNIIIGTATSSTAIQNLTTGSQNILIGNNISLPSATDNGQLNIANIIFGTGITSTGSTLSSGNVGIGSTTPWRKLSVTGTVGLDGLGSSGGTATLCLTDNKEVVTNNGACVSSSEFFKHDIAALSLSGIDFLSAITPSSFVYNNDTSSTTRWGFIAQQLASTSPHFIDYYDAGGNPRTIDTTSILAVAVKAIQELIVKVQTLADSVAGFADHFTTKELTFTRAIGDEIDVKRLKADETTTDKLCVGDAAGATCISRAQLDALLQQAGQSPTAAPPDPAPQSSPTPVATTSAETTDAATSSPAVTESALPVTEPIVDDSPPLAPEEEPEKPPTTTTGPLHPIN